LADIHHEIADLLHEMPISVAPQIARDGLVDSLRRMADAEWAGTFDEITWAINPAAQGILQNLSTLDNEVIYYATREALRNAARHGRGDKADRPLQLRIEMTCADDLLQVTVEDDGVGLDAPDAQARRHTGNGLALHSTMMAIIGGALTLDSTPGQGTRV